MKSSTSVALGHFWEGRRMRGNLANQIAWATKPSEQKGLKSTMSLEDCFPKRCFPAWFDEEESWRVKPKKESVAGSAGPLATCLGYEAVLLCGIAFSFVLSLAFFGSMKGKGGEGPLISTSLLAISWAELINHASSKKERQREKSFPRVHSLFTL